jgi:hypothetical protein
MVCCVDDIDISKLDQGCKVSVRVLSYCLNQLTHTRE